MLIITVVHVTCKNILNTMLNIHIKHNTVSNAVLDIIHILNIADMYVYMQQYIKYNVRYNTTYWTQHIYIYNNISNTVFLYNRIKYWILNLAEMCTYTCYT